MLVGLAISFALPTFAQQTNTPDPQLREALAALSKKTDEGYKNGDAAALAALYTEDAVFMANTGPIYGREAIEKHFVKLFQNLHFSNHLDKADQYSPHMIGPSGNEAWSTGEWSVTYQVKSGSPVELKGYWLEIYEREGDTWEKQVDAWNVAPAPAPTAAPSTTTTPSNK
jgi:ketosteroid isomerase-like protein